ncbi:MAG: ion channel [Saprospiraceae bacterium]
MIKKAHLHHIRETLPFAGILITNFTTTGMDDIVPQTPSARIFISSELIISFFFTIFIIANLAMLRDSYTRKNLKI